jgi:hypothetical protein
VGPRAGLDDVEKILAPTNTRTPTLGRPARSQSLYRLTRHEDGHVETHRTFPFTARSSLHLANSLTLKMDAICLSKARGVTTCNTVPFILGAVRTRESVSSPLLPPQCTPGFITSCYVRACEDLGAGAIVQHMGKAVSCVRGTWGNPSNSTAYCARLKAAQQWSDYSVTFLCALVLPSGI